MTSPARLTDAITPRQFGVSQLGLLRPLRRMLRGGSLDRQAPLSYADADEHEDSDVSNERLLIQELVAGAAAAWKAWRVQLGECCTPPPWLDGRVQPEELLLESLTAQGVPRRLAAAQPRRRCRAQPNARHPLNECFASWGPTVRASRRRSACGQGCLRQLRAARPSAASTWRHRWTRSTSG